MEKPLKGVRRARPEPRRQAGPLLWTGTDAPSSSTLLSRSAIPDPTRRDSMHRRLHVGIFVLLIIISAATGPIFAQSQANTGTIEGVVADATGRSIPGA